MARQLTEHFTRAEFACPHCGECFVRPRLLKLAEAIRQHTGKPLQIVSGYRCPIHNRAVGGKTDSQHVYGAACDVPSGTLSPAEASALGAVGVGRKGQWAIHVDVRDGLAASWSY